MGDAPDSFAYDGKRLKKWNVASTTYGQPWVVGDVISCCIDLTNGTMQFFRNGISMGEAFSNVRYGDDAPGLAYFPALSLSWAEKSRLNFGGRPFMYPIPDYQPMQSPPTSVDFATYLCQSLDRLMRSSRSRDDVMLIGGIIFDQLAPLLQDDYNVVASFFPMLTGFSESSDLLSLFIEHLRVWLEDWEWNSLWELLLEHLGHILTSTSSHGDSKSPLGLIIKLLRFPHILGVLTTTQSENSDRILEQFFATKQPNPFDLVDLLPKVWWPNCQDNLKFGEFTELLSEVAPDEETMKQSVQDIRVKNKEQDDLFYEILLIFLPNSQVEDPMITDSQSESDFKKKWFKEWLHRLLERNKGSNRNVILNFIGNC